MWKYLAVVVQVYVAHENRGPGPWHATDYSRSRKVVDPDSSSHGSQVDSVFPLRRACLKAVESHLLMCPPICIDPGSSGLHIGWSGPQCVLKVSSPGIFSTGVSGITSLGFLMASL